MKKRILSVIALSLLSMTMARADDNFYDSLTINSSVTFSLGFHLSPTPSKRKQPIFGIGGSCGVTLIYNPAIILKPKTVDILPGDKFFVFGGKVFGRPVEEQRAFLNLRSADGRLIAIMCKRDQTKNISYPTLAEVNRYGVLTANP